jgi:DNA-binding NarL/FixJ family response regulator
MPKRKAETGTKTTQVLIVDDHTIVREGLSALLSRQPHLKICGEAADAESALKQIKEKKPDLVILDISLREGSGLDLIKQIHADDEGVKMLILSVHDETLFAERAVRAGAMGYLSKEQSRERILEAIDCVLSGKVYLSHAMTQRVLESTLGRDRNAGGTRIESLTDRELQVFEAIGQGLTVREIAKALDISPKTVETYRDNIKVKLDVANTTELVRHAVQWKLEQA